MMNCNVVRDLLPLYADGLTSPESNQLIEDHTETCPECRRFLESLRMPMEAPPPEDDCDRLIKALRRRIRRRQIITVSICVLIPLAILLGWYIHKEIHFSSYQIKIDNTDSQRILAEEPRVEVTADDIAFANALFAHPIILEEFATFNSDIEFIEIDSALVEDISKKHLPENFRISEFLLWDNHAMLVYYCGETRFLLEMYDGDGTGHVDVISKTVVILDENGNTKYMYNCDCQIATNHREYHRWDNKRQWFDFLIK